MDVIITKSDLASALARVQGLLGPEAVALPQVRGGRGPLDRSVLVPLFPADLERGAVPVPVPAGDPPWPGRVPPPAPAVLHRPPLVAVLVDDADAPVGVTGRGQITAAPCRVAIDDGGTPLPVVAWAGPWPADERWWAPGERRRRARCQVLTAGGTAHLLVLEGGRWWVEATYD